MYVQSANQPTYETIWYELVDLYPFVGEDLSALTQLPEFLEAQQ